VGNKEMRELVKLLENEFDAGLVPRAEVIRAKIDVAVAEAQIQSAIATEYNARYMLWSVIIAAIAAVISAASVLIGK
jgi:outer membrane protein TolC